MGKRDLIKFRYGEDKGIFHYTVFEGKFVALSEIQAGKVKYIREHGSLDITFDLQSETYDVMDVDIIEDDKFVKKVFNYMLENNNNYFKDGFAKLCVLKFHK